jgi:hypothetical protein
MLAVMAPSPTIRWYHPTPGRAVALLLGAEGVLFARDLRVLFCGIMREFRALREAIA